MKTSLLLSWLGLVSVCSTTLEATDNEFYQHVADILEKEHIPAISLKRFLQMAEADDDPEIRVKLPGDKYKILNAQGAIKLLYPIRSSVGARVFQQRYESSYWRIYTFNISGIKDIHDVKGAHLVIQDYNHTCQGVQTYIHFAPRKYRKRQLKKTAEGYTLNTTRYFIHRHRLNRQFIRITISVQNNSKKCGIFNKFSIAFAVQMNLNVDMNANLSATSQNLLNWAIQRETLNSGTNYNLEKIPWNTLRPVTKHSRMRREDRLNNSTSQQTLTATSLLATASSSVSNTSPRTIPLSTPITCHLRPWTLTFEEIGWDYVLVPRSYGANVCDGICPYLLFRDDNLNYTMYSGILALYHFCTASRDHSLPKPHCTPVEYAPLTFFYHEEDGSHTINRLAEMKVTSCGCR